MDRTQDVTNYDRSEVADALRRPAAAGSTARRVWRCTRCHGDSIHGGVRQRSKTRGEATCYWCGTVEIYLRDQPIMPAKYGSDAP